MTQLPGRLRCASLHPYLRARSETIAQSIKPFVALELRLPLRTIMPIDRMNAKDGFCNIDPRSRNLHAGLLLTL